jgi:hypothetical protein
VSAMAVATPADAASARAPRPALLAAVAFVGCAAAGCVAALALTSDDLEAPVLRAALHDWIILPYVLAGVVAWWRRPASALGRLMVAAGFATGVSGLVYANAALPHTIGEAFDFLPPVLFLHVFLAYPTGRLQSRLERIFVATAYAVAILLQLVVLTLSDQPWNLLLLLDAPAAATAVQKVLLCSLGALSLAGIGVLAFRRRREGRPFRRSLGALVESFVLGLVMIAALFLSNVLGSPGVEPSGARRSR